MTGNGTHQPCFTLEVVVGPKAVVEKAVELGPGGTKIPHQKNAMGEVESWEFAASTSK